MGEDDPDGDLGGGLPPGVPDEPDVGHHHQHEHDGVEGEDGGDALPVGQQGPALRHLAVLGRLVVDHAHDHQQEARSNLHTRHASYVWLFFAIQYNTEKAPSSCSMSLLYYSIVLVLSIIYNDTFFVN